MYHHSIVYDLYFVILAKHCNRKIKSTFSHPLLDLCLCYVFVVYLPNYSPVYQIDNNSHRISINYFRFSCSPCSILVNETMSKIMLAIIIWVRPIHADGFICRYAVEDLFILRFDLFYGQFRYLPNLNMRKLEKSTLNLTAFIF